ncbi:MAG: serine hydrolase [Candidatus Aminicenantales bacterium]
MYSSLDDLMKWEEAWWSQKLLTNSDIELALTPVSVPGAGPTEPDGAPAAYGFGWFLNPWKGHKRSWHYAETRGFRTALHRLLDKELTVIVLAHRSNLDANSLCLRVAALYLGINSRKT